MNECAEVAKQHREAYARWLLNIGLMSRLCLAREFVQCHVVPHESVAVIDNIAAALHNYIIGEK